MPCQFRIINTLCRNLRKSRLESREKLRLELAVKLASLVAVFRISCHIRIKQNGVDNFIRILAETTDTDRQFQSRIVIRYLERNLTGCTVFISYNFLRIEIIDPLVLARIPAKSKTAAYLLEHGKYTFLIQTACKKRRFRGTVIRILPRLGTKIHHLAGLDNHHALSVINGNHRPVRYDIILTAGIRTPPAGPLLPFHHQHIGRHTVAIEKFFPLVRQYTACRTDSRFNQTHRPSL